MPNGDQQLVPSSMSLCYFEKHICQCQHVCEQYVCELCSILGMMEFRLIRYKLYIIWKKEAISSLEDTLFHIMRLGVIYIRL